MKQCLLLCLLLILVTCIWGQVESCFDCEVRHPQEHFCNYDFAIKATVKSSEDVSPDYEAGTGYRAHEVKVKRWFKTPPGVSDSTITVLQIKGADACGPVLETKGTYLLMGNYNESDGLYSIPICSTFSNDWVNVAGPLKTKLKRGQYLANCDCGVKLCPRINWMNVSLYPSVTLEECLNSGDDYCTTEATEAFCLQDLAVCMRDTEGKCAWKTWGGYRKCIKN